MQATTVVQWGVKTTECIPEGTCHKTCKLIKPKDTIFRPSINGTKILGIKYCREQFGDSLPALNLSQSYWCLLKP